MKLIHLLLIAISVSSLLSCTNNSVGTGIDYWITKADQSMLLQKQTSKLVFGTENNNHPFIDINAAEQYQTIDGFGFTLTGGSAYLVNRLGATTRDSLLKELFGRGENAIGISYLRISIGSSDLDSVVFSYDDVPEGQTDTALQHFSLQPDKPNLVPVLKEILAITPQVKILGSPWSPPAWMKDNRSTKGGSLRKEYYPIYAKYLVRYIQAMRSEGITVDAITPQNEPLNPDNNPSLYMTAVDQADFIKNHLGPAFRAAGLTTKIIVYDHNCDRPDYPLTILNDTAAKAYVDGSAFHLYNGDISALSQVHNQHPDKQLYFTEQYTPSDGKFEGDFRWHVKNVIIGSMRNWSRTALEWNLANDPSFNPHTPGGCTTCKGGLTIGNDITRNVGYYIIAHASKFIPPGSVRIGSSLPDNLPNAAFKTPEGKTVLIVLNENNAEMTFNIRIGEKWASTTLAAGAAATYVW